jgi:hypothetical protein
LSLRYVGFLPRQLDNTGSFKVVTYEPGDWQRELLDWPDPVPFD